jgi:hypothetical protein
MKEILAIVPIEKVLSIILDYTATDPELLKTIIYIQSEEFPKIHKVVEYIKEYKDVSAFICMLLKPQSDRENMSSFSTGI